MSKSKYPNQIDTPSELPIVRDNIFEIGSDAINSLRSAIIQIEKTLGVNPNGAVGLTVGERISQSLDQSGNIKREAIDRAGVISGPIFDDQVSDSAAIKESKLKLNFPTQILQSQISFTASLIDEIQSQIEQISAKLSAHLSPDAANRHSAKSISTTAIAATVSPNGIRDSVASNVQSVLDSIFSSHINYDGTLITDINNSHLANQIYFDNATTNVTSSDVQGALEEVADFLQTQVVGHQNLFHGAGSAKSSVILDKDNSSYGTLYIESATSSINKNLGEKPYFEIILDLPVLASGLNISTGDMVELTINSVAKEYQIYKVEFDIAKENIIGFLLFGIFESDVASVSTVVFSRKFRKKSNFGLLSGIRENYGFSSSNIAQVINLDAPYLESNGINPNEISVSNRFFDIKINGTQYSFDVYNVTSTVQSIDSIIKKINETVDNLSLPILAYRVDKEGLRSEIVIAHNISSSDYSESSLEVVRNDGSIDSLGLTEYEDRIIYGEPGSSYYIAGEKYTGLLKKLDLTGFDLQAGSLNINSGALAIDFINYGVKKGDIVNVIDSSYMNCYEIINVTSAYITLSSRQLPSGLPFDSIASARLVIYDSSINISNSEFLKIGVETALTTGSSLFEIFLDKNRKINANLILEQESEIYSSKSIYQILNFKNNEDITSFVINFETTIDSCVNISLDNSDDKKKIVGDDNYIKLKSNIKNFECYIFVPSVAAAFNYANSIGGSFSKTVYLNSKINKENNLIISNIHYTNSLGKFDGGINGSLSLSKLNIGNLEEKDISTVLKAELTELPISELRSSGIVSGLKITEVSDPDGYMSGYYLVSIEAGICYIEGKRFVISAIDNFNTGIDAALYDKLYIGIDYNGNFVFSEPDPICSYPWSEDRILLLGTVENTGAYYSIIDQRLFINDLDLRLLNSITVSPQPGMGHFTDIRDAIAYAKKFSEIFPKAGTPEIHLKSGTYSITLNGTTSLTLANWFTDLAIQYSESRVNYFNNIIQNGLFIDFPVTIRGEGETSRIEVIYTLVALDQTVNLSCGFFVAGSYFNTTPGMSTTRIHSRISSGVVSFNNFYMQEGWITLGDIGLTSKHNKFEINNVIFYDETDITSLSSKVTFYFGSDPFFGIVLSEIDNTSVYKGNVYINGCSFINLGNIRLYPDTTPSRYKYISILNSFSSSSGGISAPLFSSISKFPSENKVYSLSNITSSRTPYDRISSNLLVGANIAVNGKYNTINPNRDGTTSSANSPILRFQEGLTIIPTKVIKPIPGILYKIHPSSISAENIVYDSSAFAGIYASSSATTTEIKLILPISDYFISSMYQNYVGDGSEYATVVTEINFSFQGTHVWTTGFSDIIATIEFFVNNPVGATSQISSLTTNITKSNLENTSSFYSPSINTSSNIILGNGLNHYAVVTLKCGLSNSSPKLYSSRITANIMGIHPG